MARHNNTEHYIVAFPLPEMTGTGGQALAKQHTRKKQESLLQSIVLWHIESLPPGLVGQITARLQCKDSWKITESRPRNNQGTTTLGKAYVLLASSTSRSLARLPNIATNADLVMAAPVDIALIQLWTSLESHTPFESAQHAPESSDPHIPVSKLGWHPASIATIPNSPFRPLHDSDH